MTKKEVLLKVAGLWTGALNLGARVGKGILKNSPKITSFAGKHPRTFTSMLTGTAGAGIGAGIGALKDPGTDEFGQPKSRLGNIVKGGLIGGAAGGALGATRIGTGFGRGIGVANKNPEILNRLKNFKKGKPFHPIRKAVGTAAVVGGTMAAVGVSNKLLETQSNQVTQGNQKIKFMQ